MNQSASDTGRSSQLSEVLNPNYEDPSPGWGTSLIPSALEDFEFPSYGPEYLNAAQSSRPPVNGGDSLDNPDYQADFLPQQTRSGLFLPAVENLEYLGAGAAVHGPVR